MAALLGKAREIDEIDNFLDPEYFYEHGDNPAYKQLIDVMAANSFAGKTPEYRSTIVDTKARWLMARGFDDFLQRDLKIYNSPRALIAFLGASIGFVNVVGWTNRLLPVGQFGITRLSQTPFFHKFGKFPTLLVMTVPYLALYSWFRVSSYCLRKIWNHVVLQEREYGFEEKKLPYYGEYYFNDTPLADSVSWNKFGKKPMQHLAKITPSVPKPTWDE